MSEASKYELAAYADPESAAPVFCLRAIPEFTPLDVNLAFLVQTGWNQSAAALAEEDDGHGELVYARGANKTQN